MLPRWVPVPSTLSSRIYWPPWQGLKYGLSVATWGVGFFTVLGLEFFERSEVICGYSSNNCFYDNNVVRKHYDVKAVGHFIIDYGSGNVPVELKGYAIDVDAGIEIFQEYYRGAQGSTEGSGLSLEEMTKVRLSYGRVVKARRESWAFKVWLGKWFSDRILTIEEAKPLAISFFSREIQEELERLQRDSQPAATSA